MHRNYQARNQRSARQIIQESSLMNKDMICFGTVIFISAYHLYLCEINRYENPDIPLFKRGYECTGYFL